jgi:hypothetical protein
MLPGNHGKSLQEVSSDGLRTNRNQSWRISSFLSFKIIQSTEGSNIAFFLTGINLENH